MPDMPNTINILAQVSLFVVGAYLIAFYLGLVVWTARDIGSRSRDWLVRFLAVLLVAVFSLPGLLLYFILRPKETLSEVYARALEEEALLQGIEDQSTCTSCRRRVAQDFAVCPYCRTSLKGRCTSCRRLLNPNWKVCPYCGQEPKTARAASVKAQPAQADEAKTPAT